MYINDYVITYKTKVLYQARKELFKLINTFDYSINGYMIPFLIRNKKKDFFFNSFKRESKLMKKKQTEKFNMTNHSNFLNFNLLKSQYQEKQILIHKL